MKNWENADVVELTIKSTYNDRQTLGYDGPITGANGQVLDGLGTPIPDESGNIGEGTFYPEKKQQP